jgi:hypothetical protein
MVPDQSPARGLASSAKAGKTDAEQYSRHAIVNGAVDLDMAISVHGTAGAAVWKLEGADGE